MRFENEALLMKYARDTGKDLEEIFNEEDDTDEELRYYLGRYGYSLYRILQCKGFKAIRAYSRGIKCSKGIKITFSTKETFNHLCSIGCNSSRIHINNILSFRYFSLELDANEMRDLVSRLSGSCMSVSIQKMKSGITTVYLGSGSLHYNNFLTGYTKTDLKKRNWYFDGEFKLDNKCNLVLSGNSEENIKVLSSKRSVVYSEPLYVRGIYMYSPTGGMVVMKNIEVY